MELPTLFDRSSQDVGNIVFFEHVNLRVPEQGLATIFYLEGLGLTRDPFYMVGTGNMWVNIGRQQLHLESGREQRFRGQIGMVLPDLDELATRLAAIENRLAGTNYRWSGSPGLIKATCPWGNSFCIHDRIKGFSYSAGIPYVEMHVPFGAAQRIESFYSVVLQAKTSLSGNDETGRSAVICVGPGQKVIYSETRRETPAFDGHHICLYLSSFSRPYQLLKDQGAITAEDNDCQYRFEAITAPGEPNPAFLLQHEIRSLHHPLYLRQLVNRTGKERLP